MYLAVGETVILLTPLSIHIETPTKGRGGVQQNDSLADGYTIIRLVWWAGFGPFVRVAWIAEEGCMIVNNGHASA